MASIDILGELKLNAYYKQGLALSEAIELPGETKNDCPAQYGVEIVRKLLMFDSTAVVSLTTELNKRLNNTNKKKADIKLPTISADSTPPLCSSNNAMPVDRESDIWSDDEAVPAEREFHPMDLLVVVMNCCDDFLRQVLVEKMFANKLSIPILLPDLRNGSYTLLLLALRSLVPEIRVEIGDGANSLSDTVVDMKTPIISFIRLGTLLRSKSKIVNEILSLNSFNTFFHRECPNGWATRSISMGSIDAAWFQSETVTEEEFNCKLFTAMNLRGDARDYSRQTQFLCQTSTLVVFMVESLAKFKDFYENLPIELGTSQAKIILCYISSESPDTIDQEYKQYMKGLIGQGVISTMINDWHQGKKKLSDNELTNLLRQKISKFLKQINGHSERLVTYRNILQRVNNSPGFSFDEDQVDYKKGRASADKFVDFVSNLTPGCKPKILPLQSEPWKQIGKLEREQYEKSEDKEQDEYLISDKEMLKRQQRAIQCRSLIKTNEIAETFSLNFHLLQEKNLLYFLNSCKIKLDERSRIITLNLMEEYEKEKQNPPQQHEDDESARIKLRDIEVKLENSTIGLEHILREHGQMYEAVISEEIRMMEELKNAKLIPNTIRNFPTIMARLLLMGQPLELMDGDTSNVPITWLKAVLDQINIMTNNAKVFVLSIIGVQSSGKSTLLNALFGLQFPSSSGRCTKGIYCQLVPFEKESLKVKFNYVLVVDTEGLGSSYFTGNSTFRDNELATFAIGMADVTIINMKGENWAEMKDILQVVIHGLIRVRRTKADLDLMPKCMFVHQNVPATDAEEKNRLGQEKQLILLDATVKEACGKEGFEGITKFEQLIEYDPKLHSWYFPDLWHGKPPKARISQGYIGKTNLLRQNLLKLMRSSSSKLTISSFFLRMSDLWNAMLHNNFVLCYRSTQEIRLSTALNDRISHEVDSFKNLNNLAKEKIGKSICSVTSIENCRAVQENMLKDASDAVEQNFERMRSTLRGIIDATDIYSGAREKCEVSLNEIKGEELRRIKNETENDLRIHMKKLENESDQGVCQLKARMVDLEKCIEALENDKLNETVAREFEESWDRLIADSRTLLDDRINIVKSNISETIRGTINELSVTKKVQLNAVRWEELFEMPFDGEIPQIKKTDIVPVENYSLNGLAMKVVSTIQTNYQSVNPMNLLPINSINFLSHNLMKFISTIPVNFLPANTPNFLSTNPAEFLKTMPFVLMEYVYSNSHIRVVNNSLRDAQKRWELQLQNQRNREFNASDLEQIVSEIGRLMGILEEGHDVSKETDEACSALAPGFSYTAEYVIRFIKCACHFAYSRSVENSTRFVSMTDPLADIDKRCERSRNKFQQMSVEANIAGVSKQIFKFTRDSFVRDLGELLKTELCQEDAANSTFKTKRAFLKTILTDLGQRTNRLSDKKERKETIFKEFMLYVDMGAPKASKEYFFRVILRFMKEILTNKNGTESDFQKMVQNNVGSGVEKARQALRQAQENCNGCEKTYIENFKDNMNVTSEIDFRINTLSGFTEAVIGKISNLYSNFLNQANSSFDTLACKDDKAAIRPLFEKIMGCRERCPLCSAPCTQSLQHHAGDHRANHYPTGVTGTVDYGGWFLEIQETYDATEAEQRKKRKLAVETCQTMVGTTKNIRTSDSLKKYSKWYHHVFNWNFESLAKYKEVEQFVLWDIPYSADLKTSLYWKWFMAQFAEELAEHYQALCPKIPEAWKNITWEEAKDSLDGPELCSESKVED